MIPRSLLVPVLILALLPVVPPAYGQPPSSPQGVQDPQAAGSETAAVEELARILVQKGILPQEDVAAIMEKKGEPGFSGLAALTQLLKAKGVLTSDEADRVAKTSEAQAARPVVLLSERDRKDFEKMTKDATAEIKQEVKEQVKAEVKDEVLQETRKEIQSAAPEWTKRIQFGGDIRLRYEADDFSRNNAQLLNPSSPTTLMNTTDNQERYRVRARLGATAEIDDNTEAGVRLTTGSAGNPVTEQQTMGVYFGNYSAYLDLAYLKTRPVPGLTLIGGKITNPFFFSDLVWWKDLTFEGFSGTYKQKLSDVFEGFATAGAFPIWKTTTFDESDKWLYAGQVGLDIKPRKELQGRIGVAYYDFEHTRGIPNTADYPDQNDYTAPQFEQKGNTLYDISASPSTTTLALASEYRELNVTASLDIGFWDPIHVVLLGDYVNNIGFDRSTVAALTGNPGITAQTQGYQVGLSVGHPEILHFPQWRAFGYYRYLQADSVIDAFTDPDFHLGGTNAKGWIIGADLGLYKNFWLSLKYTSANEITGPPLAIDSLFLDLNARF
jgi:hypothetical protein